LIKNKILIKEYIYKNITVKLTIFGINEIIRAIKFKMKRVFIFLLDLNSFINPNQEILKKNPLKTTMPKKTANSISLVEVFSELKKIIENNKKIRR